MIKQLDLADFETRAINRLIVRQSSNAYPHICNYLRTEEGFSEICRLDSEAAARTKAGLFAKTKICLFKNFILDSIYVFRNIRRLRRAKIIVAVGHIGATIALLLKAGLFPLYPRIYWIAFFIHDPRWFGPLRIAFSFLDSKTVRYVLFSRCEKALYAKALRLDPNRMFYVPYGEMKKDDIRTRIGTMTKWEPDDANFYFSGGYSNRDYVSLIEVFREMRTKLVIICSSLNSDIDRLVVPPNVKVLRDMSSELFDGYVRKAKACIIPMLHNTGAAGQSCLLRYMKNRKLIIATNTDIVKEYIEDGISGAIIPNNREGLAAVIRLIEENPAAYDSYGEAAYVRFEQLFSYEAISRRLSDVLAQ